MTAIIEQHNRCKQKFSVILLIPLLISCSHRINQATISPSVKSQLSEEVRLMDQKDQLYRWKIIFGELDDALADSLSKLPTEQKIKHIKKAGSPEYKLSKRQYDSLVQLQKNLDAANQVRIIQIYETYGWPGSNLIGKEAGLVGVMMLHFPVPLKLSLYPKLKREYKGGNINGTSVARMYDKYLLEVKKPLLYGMFDHYDSTTKATLPPMIKNIKKTNRARRKLGLPPLEKYRISKSISSNVKRIVVGELQLTGYAATTEIFKIRC